MLRAAYAGASLGSLRMAHRGAAAAMNVCEAEKFALIRFVETTPRAHLAPRKTTFAMGNFFFAA